MKNTKLLAKAFCFHGSAVSGMLSGQLLPRFALPFLKFRNAKESEAIAC
ncbi:hypothetical protein N5V81_25945 [Escherichia coli]|nr:hypothetical protein [Escherichia coli]